MLCGNVPFNGGKRDGADVPIVNFAPPAPSAGNHAVPELLDYIVAKMLAKAARGALSGRAGTGAETSRVRAPTGRAAGLQPYPPAFRAGARTAAEW